MLHDPTTLFCLLPSIYGFGYVDVNIFYITHIESMERDLHICTITDLVLLAYEFGSQGEHSCYDLCAGASDVLMLSLRTIGTPELYKMHP
jgi:hypothetical protein